MGSEPSITLGLAWEEHCLPLAHEIAIQLSRGNWEAAHEVVDRIEAAWKCGFDGQRRVSRDPREVALHEVLPLRLVNTLEQRFSVLTVADLNALPWEAIAATPNVGPAAQKMILEAWRELGFQQRKE